MSELGSEGMLGERLSDRDQQLKAFIEIYLKRANGEELAPEDVTQMIDVRADLDNEFQRLGNGRPEGDDLDFYTRLTQELPEKYGIPYFADKAADRELGSLERYRTVNGEGAMNDIQKARLEELRTSKDAREAEKLRQEDINARNVKVT